MEDALWTNQSEAYESQAFFWLVNMIHEGYFESETGFELWYQRPDWHSQVYSYTLQSLRVTGLKYKCTATEVINFVCTTSVPNVQQSGSSKECVL